MKKSFFKKGAVAGLVTGAALAIAALAPQAANAATAAAPGTAANAQIINVVTVNYYDASGANLHQASTSTSVFVALKQAPLTVATQVTFPTVDSGLQTTSYVALTANANGPDSYKVNFSDTPTNLSNNPIVTNIVTDITGGTSSSFASGGSVSLGATAIVSVAGPVSGSQVISIPGGALNGIGVGSIVVINDISYKVTGVSTGQTAVYSKTGVSTTLGSMTRDEQLGTITIAKDVNGSNVDPNLSGSLAGTIVGERKYLQIQDTGTVSSNTANGTDLFSIDTDTTTNAGSAYKTAAITDLATFYFVSLSINKSVANITNPAAGAFGKPGDVLEYTVTVNNTSTGGNASKVSISDAVPAYTTLVSGSAYGAGGGSGAKTEVFATINDGTYTVNATLDPTDPETQPGGATYTGFGGTVNNAVTAGTVINFYLGTSSSNVLGGTVTPAKTYTIKYQVKIN